MEAKNVLTIAAVAMFALVIGQAQAESIEVPNGDFETLYKPGSTTITATLDDGEWFKANNTNQGLNCTLEQGGIADYSDGTTGDAVDFPGWTWNVGSSDNMMGGAWGGVDGGMGLGVFTGWGGATQVESANPLSVPFGLTYELSAMIYHNGRPINLDLLVDGVVLTPDTSVDAPGVDNTWGEMSRTYSSIPAGDVTILFGTLDVDETGNRASIDNITLEVTGLMYPSPEYGETVLTDENLELSWTNLPNDGNDVYVDVWFGTEPNELHPGYDMTRIVTAGENTDAVLVDASALDTYYWQVNSYLNGADHINDANMIEGGLWLFYATDDLPPTVEMVTLDQRTWSGEGVPLDSTVTDDAASALTVEWTADAASLANPNLTIEILNADQADATVTITKAVPTGDVVTVTMTVAVSDEGNPTADTASIEIDVYDDACIMAKVAHGRSAITDFDENCITGLEDLVVIVAAWLDDYAATGSADRP